MEHFVYNLYNILNHLLLLFKYGQQVVYLLIGI